MGQHGLAAMSVAVVDDDIKFLQLMSCILRSFNIANIYECRTALAAINCLRNRPVDLVLADHVMPEMSGLELIRVIRTVGATPRPDVPIVCVSAHTGRDFIEEAVRAGADDWLAKPVRPIDLFRRLVSLVREPLPRIRLPHYAGPDRRCGMRRTYEGPERRCA